MGQCVSCLDEGEKQQRKEEERLASIEARAKAAEAAQKRQEDFEKTAAGRAARAQMAANAKQSANTNKGEPVLKVILNGVWADVVIYGSASLLFCLLIKGKDCIFIRIPGDPLVP